MSPFIIALAVGILAYVIFIMAVPNAVPEAKDDHLKAALNRLEEETKAAEEARESVLREQLNEAPPLVRAVFSLPFMRPMYQAGLTAGYQNSMQQLLVLMLLVFGVASIGFTALNLDVAGFLMAGLLAYGTPFYWCSKKLKRRNHKFVDHFPDALDMIVRSVRSGFPLTTAMQLLAENAEEPVRSEFRQVTDEIALGRSLGEALARLATRINEPDVRFFVVVLTVQQETGGNLAEIIGNLSSIIRKRKQIRHKIRALTAEGKTTGIILGALPVLVFGALYWLQPGYLQPFFYDPLGQQLFATTLVLLVTCFFIVKKMINVEI